MLVRAKFKCVGVTKQTHWRNRGQFLYTADFSAVTDDSEENKKYWEATPTGSIKLSTISADFFTPGVSYYIDFTEVDGE